MVTTATEIKYNLNCRQNYDEKKARPNCCDGNNGMSYQIVCRFKTIYLVIRQDNEITI